MISSIATAPTKKSGRDDGMKTGASLWINYFSGTGNALTACRWIAEKASGQGMEANIQAIDRFDRHMISKAPDEALLGFAYPTHGFALPWYMLKYILFFPRGSNPVFLLNTRAGMKIGSWNTPGLSGLALLLPLLILLIKGYRIIGLMSLDMPSNWISIHPGLLPGAVSFIVDKCRAKVDRFSEKILNGRRTIPWYVPVFLPLDLAVSPISILYLCLGRFFLAKTFFASQKCDGCQICAEYCPVGAIRIIDDRPYWTFYCESCMRCMNTCPRQAIETAHSIAALMIAVTTSLPVTYYLTVFIRKSGLTLSEAAFYIADHAVNWLLTLLVIYILYVLVFALLRNPWINRFFLYSSLTFYWARYKAPGISLKDFKRSAAEPKGRGCSE